jgi:hypothetical protein
MGPARPGTEDCAGEWQQRFTRKPKYIQVDTKRPNRAICPRKKGVSIILLLSLKYKIIFK